MAVSGYRSRISDGIKKATLGNGKDVKRFPLPIKYLRLILGDLVPIDFSPGIRTSPFIISYSLRRFLHVHTLNHLVNKQYK